MNGPYAVIPAKLPSSTLRSSQFQMDALCLRERDLLDRFAAEVSQLQVKGESKEHAIMMPLDPTRRCYRMIGGVLVERTIKEVLLAVQRNKEGLEEVIARLNEALEKTKKEITEFESKYKIRIQKSESDGKMKVEKKKARLKEFL